LFLLWSNTLGRSRVAKFIWSGVGILLIYILGVFVREQYGIAVVIRNASGQPLRQLRIKSEPRGGGYDLGELSPQKKVRVFVKPGEESHLNLEYTDIVGVRHSELVVGYIEGGYCGKAEVNVLSRDKVASDEKSTRSRALAVGSISSERILHFTKQSPDSSLTATASV
jgi:hypothetical protein